MFLCLIYDWWIQYHEQWMIMKSGEVNLDFIWKIKQNKNRVYPISKTNLDMFFFKSTYCPIVVNFCYPKNFYLYTAESIKHPDILNLK